jgi:ferredoxin
VPLLARIRDLELELTGRGTVMDRCLAAGLPVASSCSGRGACGRCVIEVLEGAGALSRPTLREGRVLRRNGRPEGARLACRCRVTDPQLRIVVRTGYW